MTWAADISPTSEVVVKHSQVLNVDDTKISLIWFDAGDSVRFAPAAIFARDVRGNQYRFLLAYTPIGQLNVDQVEQWWP